MNNLKLTRKLENELYELTEEGLGCRECGYNDIRVVEWAIQKIKEAQSNIAQECYLQCLAA